jgi:hypothetical protein
MDYLEIESKIMFLKLQEENLVKYPFYEDAHAREAKDFVRRYSQAPQSVKCSWFSRASSHVCSAAALFETGTTRNGKREEWSLLGCYAVWLL